MNREWNRHSPARSGSSAKPTKAIGNRSEGNWSNCGVAPDRHSREAVALTPLPGSSVEVPLAGGATDLHAQHGQGEVEGEVAPKRRHPVDEQAVVKSPAPGAPAKDGVRILHEQNEAAGQAKGQSVGDATLPDRKAQNGRHQQRRLDKKRALGRVPEALKRFLEEVDGDAHE